MARTSKEEKLKTQSKECRREDKKNISYQEGRIRRDRGVSRGL
jgi:hypothetical protein